ncbi:SMP-30/gluconolactonase/LRE family protein [Cellulomonas marina]|uniref:Sugar lactone lactonase YvrE n=2 Tax=Cellulomonas marina TaxID=988821 RepID=A0A1I1AI23_9CELL|nr:SMP-30/gluconolactonase/LRE family protein [Cellulomonas marina]SFB36100.1 Sugar lactone lactonase YvrE [Cellulomonas marina]
MAATGTGQAEQVTEALAYHAEGPVWHPSWGGLRWVDMHAGDLLTLRADGSVDRLHVGTLAAFVRPRTRGGYVVGLQRGIGLADDVDAPPVALPELWTEGDVRMNEGGCDPAGTLYAGSMATDGSPGRGTLWRVAADGTAAPLLTPVSISNGIDVSPDGSLAYYNDTATGGTDVLDVRDGALTGRRPWWRGQDDERPDGLVVDAAGNVWVALNGAGAVRCLSPEGRTLAEVALPASGVTACTLGGEDGRDLFVTTSREGLDDPEPEAGAVFRARVEVPGKPVLPYAG